MNYGVSAEVLYMEYEELSPRFLAFEYELLVVPLLVSCMFKAEFHGLQFGLAS